MLSCHRLSSRVFSSVLTGFVVIALAAGFLILPPTAASQDPLSDPTYGEIVLEEGDGPQRVSVMSGGSVDVGINDEYDVPDGCSYGYVADAPDVNLGFLGFSDLYIYVEGEGDTTLLIFDGASGWVCDDDSYGDGDPIIVFPNASDTYYAIWVGSHNNESHDATLYISEIDPRTNAPSGQVPSLEILSVYAGRPVQGQLDANDVRENGRYIDYWSYNDWPGELAMVTVIGDFDTYVKVFLRENDRTQLIGEDDDSAFDANSYVPIWMPTLQDYENSIIFIGVTSADPNATGSYTLHVDQSSSRE